MGHHLNLSRTFCGGNLATSRILHTHNMTELHDVSSQNNLAEAIEVLWKHLIVALCSYPPPRFVQISPVRLMLLDWAPEVRDVDLSGNRTRNLYG